MGSANRHIAVVQSVYKESMGIDVETSDQVWIAAVLAAFAHGGPLKACLCNLLLRKSTEGRGEVQRLGSRCILILECSTEERVADS